MRDGAEYFTQPVPSAQRRYEAMRAYFVDDMPAAQVADRFGYSTASVHQMATLLRGGRMEFHAAAYPGTRALSAWQSIGTLLLAKCARRARTHHIDALTDDTALALALNLTALPKANHLRTYAYRVRRAPT